MSAKCKITIDYVGLKTEVGGHLYNFNIDFAARMWGFPIVVPESVNEDQRLTTAKVNFQALLKSFVSVAMEL